MIPIDFGNTYDARDDVRCLGTKKRSGATFSKFQKACEIAGKATLFDWRFPNYILFGFIWGDPNHQELCHFSPTEIWFQPKKMMIHSTKQFARYEGFLKWGVLLHHPCSSDFPWNNHPFCSTRRTPISGTPISLSSNRDVTSLGSRPSGRHYRDGPEEKHGAGGRTLWMGTPQAETAWCFQYVHNRSKNHQKIGIWKKQVSQLFTSYFGFWSKMSPVFQWLWNRQKTPWISARQFPLHLQVKPTSPSNDALLFSLKRGGSDVAGVSGPKWRV